MNKASLWVVVPAAGIGQRMEAARPKQYLTIDDKTILEHTLQRIGSYSPVEGIIIALAEKDSWWPSLNLKLRCPIYLAEGGKQRSDSVLNALSRLDQLLESGANPWVMVHDAARPCVRLSDIDKLYSRVMVGAIGGILATPVIDTIKHVDHQVISATVDRRYLWRALTPQIFRLKQLKLALIQAAKLEKQSTDESSAIEALGIKPIIVEGHADNIKITTPQDLPLAQFFIQQQNSEYRCE